MIELEYPEGATPLSPELQEDLIPDLSTQGQLNEFEQTNVTKAVRWARSSRGFENRLLTLGGQRELHRRMFDETWRWAGTLRLRETNIGVAPSEIQAQVHNLCEDCKTWISEKAYPWPDLAIRFHHRLVSIHPFPNGNGRHARLAADLLLEFSGQSSLTWGGGDLVEAGGARAEYIAALREADRKSFDRLIRFATH